MDGDDNQDVFDEDDESFSALDLKHFTSVVAVLAPDTYFAESIRDKISGLLSEQMKASGMDICDADSDPLLTGYVQLIISIDKSHIALMPYTSFFYVCAFLSMQRPMSLPGDKFERTVHATVWASQPPEFEVAFSVSEVMWEVENITIALIQDLAHDVLLARTSKFS